MPIDRDDALKRAEKLLRQGRMEAAITEYARVVEDCPGDWNTANVLGDLYLRAGQPKKAVQQFTRIADHLASEGFLPRAAAVYKKILRVTADDEHTLLQLGDIAARQGLVADAKQYLGLVAGRRRARGEKAGLAEILVRLSAVDPADAELQLRAARAAAETGDTKTASRLLRDVASEYEVEGRGADALTMLSEALQFTPDDAALRARVVTALMARGDVAAARRLVRTARELASVAEALALEGNGAAAADALLEATRLAPDDVSIRVRAVRALAESGRMGAVAGLLTREAAGDDPYLLRAYGLLQIEGGHVAEGRPALARAVRLAPDHRGDVVVLGCELAARDPDAGFGCVDVVAEAYVEQGDYAAAAAAIQQFVMRVPQHLGALLRLVEVCVDGGLESAMYEAEARLTDAYLLAGRGAEARFLADDLVAREPWVREHVDRVRRALVLLGEPEPDRVIADRLSGRSTPACAAAPDEEANETPVVDAREAEEAATADGDRREAGPTAVEIDLSELLDDLHASAVPMPYAATEPAPDAQTLAPSLEAVFETLRDEASRATSGVSASGHHERGARLLQEGQFEAGVRELEAAARDPRFRFAAAARLGRAWLERGDAAQGIEWLERATEAPAVTPEEQWALLYDLGEALERIGEGARALAVFLELETDAGAFRDTAARVARLTREQAEG